tara:strand:- start:4764 stop:6098 length:1335 start_codon:yes stop_codon:yes gene_type:complete
MALVAQVLETGKYKAAVKAGVKTEMLGDRASLYWDVLSDFYDEHRTVPSVDMFQSLCPDYDHQPTGDPLDSLVSEIKTIFLGSELNRILNVLVDENSSDPWEAKKRLLRFADEVNATHQLRNTRVVAGEKGGYVLSMIRRLRDGVGMLGMKWPVKALNDVTPGIMPGNVIYLYGRQKSKKTWLLLQWALFFYLSGYRVLMFTGEMTTEELHWRLAALILAIPLTDFNKGKVTKLDEEAIEEVMEELKQSGRFIFSESFEGLAEYKAEIEDTQPDIILHDYWKIMADDLRDSRRISEKASVDQTIDAIIKYHRKSKIPAIICGHANREGEKSKGKSSSEHAWSDHITRRVHAALRVIKSPDEKRLGIVVNAGRSMPEDLVFTLNGTLCFGFGEELDCDNGWIFSSETSADAAAASASKRKDKEPQGTSVISAIRKGAFRSFKKKK